MTLHRRQFITTTAAGLALLGAAPGLRAQTSPLRLGVGLFQPDREKNDATYRPLAEHLATRLGRPVTLRTVDSWEGLARSLASGETTSACSAPGAMCWPTSMPAPRWWPPSSTTANPSTTR